MIAEDGRTAFQIVLADDASPSTRYAAAELQALLRRISGAMLPIVSDRTPMGAHEIVLGDSAHLVQLGQEIDFDRLGGEGYVIRTVGGSLVIAGGSMRGNLYGVYGLLEDHLGCRWFTPQVSRIPRRQRLAIGPLDQTRIPDLEYREPYVTECLDGDWCARNRMNSSKASLTAKHGGKVTYFGFVHTFGSLVPPDRYFDEHPEYFSQINGRRIRHRTQLCCTNEQVIRIVTEAVRQRMTEHPDATVYSVSQNDGGNPCQCAVCSELVEAEGTNAAPVLHLVNRVAEALADRFGDKAIDTLAYGWSRKPPLTMRPHRNVIVRLCSIECCFAHPLETCDHPQNRGFVRDLKGWSQLSNRLWVWNYNTSFRHYLLPFPNQRVRDDNIRFFVSNGVRGVFEQDCYNTTGGELSSLGGYVTAKHLWNPAYGEDRAIDEFLQAVYEDAAPFVRQYVDMLHDRVEQANIHVTIRAGLQSEHLDGPLLKRAVTLFDRAEAATRDRPEVLERVRVARASVDYALFERARLGLSGAPTIDHDRFRIVPDAILARRFEPFFAAIKASGMTRLIEWMQADFVAYRGILRPLATGGELKPLEPVTANAAVNGLDYEYYEGRWKRLPDFDTESPAAAGVVMDFDLSPRARDDAFAFRYTGTLRVARAGIYTFYLKSDDGSRLAIGRTEVVRHDGINDMTEKIGHVALKAGDHPITVTFFEADGREGLEIRYAGPGIPRQRIPTSALYRRRINK